MSSSIDLSTTAKVLLSAVATTVLGEGLNYFLVYSRSDFQLATANLKLATKKLDKATEFSGEAKNAKRQKANLEQRVKDLHSELSFMKMKATVLVGVLMLVALSSLGNYFHGSVVAKLPFAPWALVQGLSHRGLPGNDETDCSFIFLYILMGAVLRTNIHKAFGWETAAPPMFDGKMA